VLEVRKVLKVLEVRKVLKVLEVRRVLKVLEVRRVLKALAVQEPSRRPPVPSAPDVQFPRPAVAVGSVADRI